jgi:V8-like Glu-specific endopeptidase
VQRPDGTEGPFCTGFAVRPSVLATNAHCVENAAAFRAKGYKLFAILNGDGRVRYELRDLFRHPGYKDGALSPDVGLIQVAGKLPRTVKLASYAELSGVAPGETMFTYGFPGRLANPKAPEATFVQGVIGRLTTFSQTSGRFEESTLIQHSAFTTGGTSGSPIFDGRGLCIGLNAGGFRGKEEVFLDDPRAGRAGRLTVQSQLAGYNYGMRIDLLSQLLARVPQ